MCALLLFLVPITKSLQLSWSAKGYHSGADRNLMAGGGTKPADLFSHRTRSPPPLGHRGSQPEPELLFRPPLCPLPSGMAPESLRVCLLNPHSRRRSGPGVQALLGAQHRSFILAKVTGLCPQNRGQQCTTG